MVKAFFYGEDWVITLKDGQLLGIRSVYEDFYQPLCYFAKRLVKNKEESEDIVVDTFMKLFRKRADFDNHSDIKSFLFVATRNACLDYIKSTHRRVVTTQDELQFLSSEEDTLHNEMTRIKILTEIYQRIENLPKQCRRIIKSLFFEGKTTAEVAEEMELSSQTVLNQKAKAVRILRLSLTEKNLLHIEMLTCIGIISLLSQF